ncbi:MAG: hypothetical protein J0H35_13035, partial [Rhodospirillales bacterium]|nr:hypothetical protein [Rhodospirillales bacterium]
IHAQGDDGAADGDGTEGDDEAEGQQRHGFAYLFISHDLKVVRALAHRVVVLRGGKIVEQGAAEDVFARPSEPYTRALMDAAFNLGA